MLSQLLLIDNVALASTSLLCEKAVNNVGAKVDTESDTKRGNIKENQWNILVLPYDDDVHAGNVNGQSPP